MKARDVVIEWNCRAEDLDATDYMGPTEIEVRDTTIPPVEEHFRKAFEFEIAAGHLAGKEGSSLHTLAFVLARDFWLDPGVVHRALWVIDEYRQAEKAIDSWPVILVALNASKKAKA